MEALWVYALVMLVASAAGGPDQPSIIGVGLIVAVSYVISRLLQSSDLELGVIRLWGVIASVLIFYVIIRVDFFDDWRIWDFGWADRFVTDISDTVSGHASAVLCIPLLWLFWMRGVARGQDPLMFEAVASSFATGIVIIVIIELLAGAVDAPAMVGYVAVPYIALGLVALGLAHAARAESEYGRSFSGTWLLAVGGAVGLLSLIAAIFVVTDLGTMRDAIVFVASWIGRGFFLVFYGVTYVIAFGVQAIIDAFFWALGIDPENARPETQVEGEPQEGDSSIDADPPEWVWVLARIVGGLGLAGIAAAALWLTFSRFLKRVSPAVLKESTYTEGRLGSDIGNLLGSMLGRLRPSLHFGGEADPVRRLYHEMLDVASSRGIERAPAQTPLEFEPSLERAFGRPAPEAITAAFDDVRYGGRAATPEEVRRLREAWDSARHSGH